MLRNKKQQENYAAFNIYCYKDGWNNFLLKL